MVIDRFGSVGNCAALDCSGLGNGAASKTKGGLLREGIEGVGPPLNICLHNEICCDQDSSYVDEKE
jgi:hypothetical protein